MWKPRKINKINVERERERERERSCDLELQPAYINNKKNFDNYIFMVKDIKAKFFGIERSSISLAYTPNRIGLGSWQEIEHWYL